MRSLESLRRNEYYSTPPLRKLRPPNFTTRDSLSWPSPPHQTQSPMNYLTVRKGNNYRTCLHTYLQH